MYYRHRHTMIYPFNAANAPGEHLLQKRPLKDSFLYMKESKDWCTNKEGTVQKSQERLKSDLGLFSISARNNNKCPGGGKVLYG